MKELESKCFKAIEDLKVLDPLPWLNKYGGLYNNCTLTPESKPTISLSFENGIEYLGISRFTTLYSLIQEYYLIKEKSFY